MASVCLELACLSANEHRDIPRDTFVKSSCVNAKTYSNVHKMLQQTLGLNRKVDLQHLIIRFGCAPVRPQVVKVLQQYKERFVAQLASEAEKAKADFSRPTFLAVAFSLVARKNKIKVDQKALIEMMCVAREDFLTVHSSMNDLCPDEVGITKKRKTMKDSKDRSEEGEDDQDEGEDEERPRSKMATTASGSRPKKPSALRKRGVSE